MPPVTAPAVAEALADVLVLVSLWAADEEVLLMRGDDEVDVDDSLPPLPFAKTTPAATATTIIVRVTIAG